MTEGYSSEEISAFASHFNRPVIVPRTELPAGVGYAEAINAGKSKTNEDQVKIMYSYLRLVVKVVKGCVSSLGGPDTKDRSLIVFNHPASCAV